MSGQEFVSEAANKHRKRLEELIIAKKGKGGATQLEAKQFTDAWVAYVKTVGINDDSVSLLYEGFQFAAGEPMYRYVMDSHSKVAYDRLFASKHTKENDQGIALRVAVNLLALELAKPTSSESVGTIVHAITHLSTNKDGKSFGTLGRSIGRILVKPLSRKRIDESIVIEEKDAAAVLSVLRGPVEGFAKNPKARSIDCDSAMQLLAWLEEQSDSTAQSDPVNEEEHPTGEASHDDGAADGGEEAETQAAADAPKEARWAARHENAERPVRIHRTNRIGEIDQQNNGQMTGSRTDEEPKEKPAQEEEPEDGEGPSIDMTTVLSFLSAYKTEHERIVASNERLRDDRLKEESRASRAEARLMECQRKNEELRGRVSDLSERNATLQTEISSLKESNESLSEDLAAAKGMLSTLERRNARQADESTKRLASALRVEYQDYLDAADLPMDADLGENMREQLRSVFKILESNGIGL